MAANNDDGPTEDDLQLESDLLRLRRQMRVMEGDRRAYSEESSNLIKRQQKEINALEEERGEMNNVMRVARSDRIVERDEADINYMMNLVDSMDDYKRQCTVEETEIRQIEREINQIKDLVIKERKVANDAGDGAELTIARRLRVTENRLDQEMVKFNSQLTTNAKLRSELDDLRIEKATYDSIYGKRSKKLEESKRAVKEYIAVATTAYEERDEAQSKMIALKERNDADNAHQEVEVKELLRIIRHDNQLKEFMGIKVNERTELREEENIKKQRGKEALARDSDNVNQSIIAFEHALEVIKASTGNDDIESIVEHFIKKEDVNFALYNYVNELNDSVENIQDEINTIEAEMKRFNENNLTNEENRQKMIREMEIAAEKYSQESDEVEKKNVAVAKVLDEIRINVEKLFKDADCDASTITAMLGSEEGVTNKNILQYMGIIEQHTMEFIKIQQYIQMLRELPKAERKDNKHQQPTPVVTPKPKQTPAVTIVAPNTVDDEDLLEEAELRPLTRHEIKNMVMKTLNTRVVNTAESMKKTNAKSNKKEATPNTP